MVLTGRTQPGCAEDEYAWSLADVRGPRCRLRARKLCEQLDDDPRFFAALVGAWAYHFVRAQYETAHGLCEQMLQLAEQSQDPVLLVMASMFWAKVHYFQGDLIAAQQLGERALALDRREYHEAYLSVYNEDGGAAG